MASTRQQLLVIFASPQQFGGGPNRYYARDGTITTNRLEAATFNTDHEAQGFADRMNIKLTATAYIGWEDFTEFELQRRKQ